MKYVSCVVYYNNLGINLGICAIWFIKYIIILLTVFNLKPNSNRYSSYGGIIGNKLLG